MEQMDALQEKKKNVFILLYNMQFVMDTDRIDCQRAL